jgi:hypothetical protein
MGFRPVISRAFTASEMRQAVKHVKNLDGKLCATIPCIVWLSHAPDSIVEDLSEAELRTQGQLRRPVLGASVATVVRTQ